MSTSPSNSSGSPQRRVRLLRVRLRGWIEWGGQSLLGPGRLRLLDLIDEHGSISAAAREMRVSYRVAWRWINEINDRAGRPLVETATGGKGGGGAQLTVFGSRVRNAVRELSERLDALGEQLEQQLGAMLDDSAPDRPER